MIVVGELINSSREAVYRAIEVRDEKPLLELAKIQQDRGADYIDVNCSAFGTDEESSLIWLITLIQNGLEEVEISLDSPNPETLLRVLPHVKGRPLINSIVADSPLLLEVVRAAKERQARVVGLCMSGSSLPKTPGESAEFAMQLISAAEASGFPLSDLFLDPLVRSVSIEPNASQLFRESMQAIKSLRPDAKTICGLSNISFGMPARRALNRAFLPIAIASGLDAVILDPTDRLLMSALHAAKALTDPVNGVTDYIAAYRAGHLVT